MNSHVLNPVSEPLPTWQLFLLAVTVMVAWSAVFASTYTHPMVWDDLHFVRSFSLSELGSTFVGENDPDGIETKALRPIATLLFHLQGTLGGDNVVLQRAMIAVLMTAFLFSLGLLLREVHLTMAHIVIVYVLIASSRVFASLTLWLVLGSLILSYIFIILTALLYMRWLKQDRWQLLALACGTASLAVFTREEAYTLLISLLLLWWISSPDRTAYRRPLVGAFVIGCVTALHYLLRLIFIPDAPQPHARFGELWLSINSAWMPGGYSAVGLTDRLLRALWIAYVGLRVVVFVRVSRDRKFEQFIGTCLLGGVLCAPSLAVARSFGIALPSLAFFTAISIAVVEVYQRFPTSLYKVQVWRGPIAALLAIGLALGVAAGLRRSAYVAQALQENSAPTAIYDAMFVFDMYGKSTIPEARREAKVSKLQSLGIRTPDDVNRLAERVRSSAAPEPPLFIPKYHYLSF